MKKAKKKRKVNKKRVFKLLLLLVLVAGSLFFISEKEAILYHSQSLFERLTSTTVENNTIENNGSFASYLVMDLTDGKKIISKNSYKSYVPASLAKLFVVDYAQEFFQINDAIQVRKEALKMVKRGSSIAKLKLRNYRFQDLVAGMLVPSGNDASYVLADAIGAKLNPNAKNIYQRMEAFRKGFQDYLKKNQFLSTSLSDPSGYDYNARTNIQDLVKVSEKLLKKDWIRSIVSSQSYSVTHKNKLEQVWFSTNLFLNPNSEFYDKRVKGMKTGSLGNHFNMITLLKKKQKEYLIIGLDAESDMERYLDIKQLMNKIPK
ncbi:MULTISPECIES: serine hydrolase [Terrabacteria group]|uniref:serine hydrolase n=1 Tax=Bacillati TaxID=1783272 RepID=UPI001C6DFE74|nr:MULTISPECIES: serine hydrolase [Terrabacteria group]MBW9211812.1 serine hydrolase [Trueperella sp. zg.1013]